MVQLPIYRCSQSQNYFFRLRTEINYVLPLGSIVSLKEGTAKMMIVNRRIFVGEQDKKKCLYPNGADFR